MDFICILDAWRNSVLKQCKQILQQERFLINPYALVATYAIK